MTDDSQKKLSLWSARLPRRRFLWALSVALALYGGVVFDHWVLMVGMPRGAENDFLLIAQAWNIIQRNYVDRGALRPSNLTRGAIQGMTDALGDTGHTTYLNPQARRHASAAMRAKFIGIGVEVQIKDHQTVIVAAQDGSPAWRAGVRAGDIILEVDGQSVVGLPLIELQDRITGPSGEPVRLGVLDPVNGREQFTNVRAAIKVENVTWRLLPGTEAVHLRVAMFSEGVGRQVRAALAQIQEQGAKGVILDLRNDPGGAVDEAVSVASEFLDGGDVFLERNSEGNITSQRVRPGGVATHLPLIVLINGGSASASEIVAGALRDAHRAMLVGTNTFGTGTVLQSYPLADGSALLLAVAEWLTHSGQSFWHKGIKPDAEVAASTNSPPLRPDDEASLTPATLQACGDPQLLRALALLTAQF